MSSNGDEFAIVLEEGNFQKFRKCKRVWVHESQDAGQRQAKHRSPTTSLNRTTDLDDSNQLAANADKQQVQRIKAVFEKKNQKSAQVIAQLQKKLDAYQKKMHELEKHGAIQSHRPPREVLRDMGQGLKNVGGNIRDGISYVGGSVMSKPREFAHLIKNKFGSADNISQLSSERHHGGSATLPAAASQASMMAAAAAAAASVAGGGPQGAGQQKFSDDGSECSSVTSDSIGSLGNKLLLLRSASTAASKPKTGVVLINMGGPEKLEHVEDYLHKIMTDTDMIQFPAFIPQHRFGPWIAKRRAPKVAKKYEEIGGGSPILKWTRLQGKLLCDQLDKKSPESAPHKPYVAFRYVKPHTEDAFNELIEDGVEHAILFSQYPQYCCATTGSSFNEIYRHFRNNELPKNLKISVIDRWSTHPLLAKCFADNIRKELEKIPEKDRKDTIILFSAHSIPLKTVNRGDAYPSEIGATVHNVMHELNFEYPYQLVWQSKVGPVPFLGPMTDDAIKDYVTKGKTSFIVVPIAFVNEHIETLHELDIEYCKELAEELGIDQIKRCPAPNDHPLFIEAMADIVQKHLKSGVPVSKKFLHRCPHCINHTCGHSKTWYGRSHESHQDAYLDLNKKTRIIQDQVESLRENFDIVKSLQTEIHDLNVALQEERFRSERLEEQINDLTELHQNEVENLKQAMADMEEKVQYQSEERLRDIHEMLEHCQTKQQQYVTLEGLDNSNARALVVKLINVLLTVLQVVLLLVATGAGIIMPFLRTRLRILSTVIIVIGVAFVLRQWPEVQDIGSHMMRRLKDTLDPVQ
ncbi:unnamed protein product [Callosobruchus maculatus]|uniref:Ferrochelatase, mitochondrial n=1 Tax=Callosobruchus maculatus TaxID=64391 RepID=A0A653BIH9_CALMS|nr:unnamed protein product [Callosobruchus maculatus]